MAHLRKLARDDNWSSCAAKLKAAEFLQTKKLLQSIVIPDNALEKAKPLQKGTDASETNLQRQKPWARQQLVWAKLWPPWKRRVWRSGSLKRKTVKWLWIQMACLQCFEALWISFLIFPRSGWIMLDWWQLRLRETGREQNHVSVSWSVQKYFMAWYNYSSTPVLTCFDSFVTGLIPPGGTFSWTICWSRWVCRKKSGLPLGFQSSPVKHAMFKNSCTLRAVQNPGCLDYTVWLYFLVIVMRRYKARFCKQPV